MKRFLYYASFLYLNTLQVLNSIPSIYNIAHFRMQMLDVIMRLLIDNEKRTLDSVTC